MEILRDISQIENKLKAIFEFDDVFDFEGFISRQIKNNEIENVKVKELSQEEIEKNIFEFSDLLFQLKNYIFALSNFVRLLLHCNLQIELYHFIKRMFVGQIGQIKYVSSKQAYTFDEKYFDRFVEIVKNCDIEKELYLPFVLSAFESDKSDPLFVWKRPAIEFMQRFFNENEEWTISYLALHPEQKYGILAMITDFNTPRGIKMLIDDFINGENADENRIGHILKKYKRETFFELDKRLIDNLTSKLDLVQILFIFGSDTEAISRLKEIYEREEDVEIKNQIAERLDIIENVSNKTEKQFMYQVRRKIKEPQERSLGLPFDRLNLTYKSGIKADNATYTYIIELFKEDKGLFNLKNLEFLYDIFEKATLNNFAQSIFEVLKRKDDIKSAKWAIRMASLLCDENQAKALAEFAIALMYEKRFKEAKYLVECLCYCGKIEVLDFFNDAKTSEYFEESWREDMMSMLVKKSGLGEDVVGDFLAIGKLDDKTIEEQTCRLFRAYINNRRFKSEYFDFLCKNEPFKSLFEHIIFGEYRFDRLNNAFYMKDGQRVYIVKLAEDNILNVEDKTSEFEIGIVHALDLDERFESVLSAPIEPLFEQFNYGRYNVKDFNAQVSELSTFAGMFILIDSYVEKMEEAGFNKNVENGNYTFSNFINLNKELNLACVVNVDRPVVRNQEYAVLSTISFYRISDLIENNGKYIFSAGDALTTGSIPARYFDYCLSTILSCAK
ncbi:MAG: hypothetical protein MR024_02595 [Firmicutes bacterium]|nr:hypothetical protein [Bacillota bacterium]